MEKIDKNFEILLFSRVVKRGMAPESGEKKRVYILSSVFLGEILWRLWKISPDPLFEDPDHVDHLPKPHFSTPEPFA